MPLYRVETRLASCDSCQVQERFDTMERIGGSGIEIYLPQTVPLGWESTEMGGIISRLVCLKCEEYPKFNAQTSNKEKFSVNIVSKLAIFLMNLGITCLNLVEKIKKP